MGIRDYLIQNSQFMHTFYEKGRLEAAMRRMPVMVLHPDTELGILGAEELAYRLMGSFSKK